MGAELDLESRPCLQMVLDARAENTAADQEEHSPQPEAIMLLVVPKYHKVNGHLAAIFPHSTCTSSCTFQEVHLTDTLPV